MAVLFVMRVERVLVWMLIALFFTVALYPLVNLVQRRLTWCHRSLATLVVFLAVVLVIGGLLAVFAVPLATEGTQLAGQLPGIVNDARAGRGPIGDLLERTNALQFVQDNQERISAFASALGTPALNLLRSVGTGLVGAVTIFVLSFLAVLEGPKLVEGTLAFPRRAERIRRVTRDCAKTVTGYISGNLLISAICGVLTYAVLKVSGVGFAGLIALFVALPTIPLVGATLGAVVACIAAFLTPDRLASRRSSSPSSTSSWRTICCSRRSSLASAEARHPWRARSLRRSPRTAGISARCWLIRRRDHPGTSGDVRIHRAGAPKPVPTVGRRPAYPSTRPPTSTTRPDCRPTPSPNGTTASRKEPRPARVRAERLRAEPRQERVDDSPWRGSDGQDRDVVEAVTEAASSSMSASTTSGSRRREAADELAAHVVVTVGARGRPGR